MTFNIFRGGIIWTNYSNYKTIILSCTSKFLEISSRNVSNLKNENFSQPIPISMAYNLHGNENITDKVPVIIMHGLFGSKNNWNSLSKTIQKRTNKKVYAVDARNHGDSPHTKEHTYFHLAEDIKFFLTEHKIEKVALIGHSMGGRAVMGFALEYPKLVESLTVVDISPVGVAKSLTAMKKVITALKNVNIKEGVSLFEARRMAEKQLLDSTGDARIASFLTLNLIEKSRGQFSWKVNVDDIERNYDPHMTIFPYKNAMFPGPTLFVIGGESDYVNMADEFDIRTFFMDSDFVTIEGAGHWLHVEKPNEFLDSVCKYINDSRVLHSNK